MGKKTFSEVPESNYFCEKFPKVKHLVTLAKHSDDTSINEDDFLVIEYVHIFNVKNP